MADYNITAITRRVVFDGSSGLGPYAFTFEVLDQNDVAVYFNTTLLTITTDYTVTVNANGTGSVTIVTGSSVPSTPIASDSITIVGARDIERVTDFVTAGDLLASSLNEQLDALTIFDQQISEENARSLRAPVYDPELVADGGTLDMTLPKKADRAGKLLQFNSTTGNPEVVTEIGEFKGNWAASTTYSARDIVKDTSTNNIFIANTAHTSSGSEPLTTNTDSAKWDLLVDAATATTSATNAATSASDAQKLAINAEDSQYTLSDSTTGYSALHYAAKAEDFKDTAVTQAGNALSSATAANNAKDATIAARDATFDALDNFDDRYLGSMADSQAQATVSTTGTWTTDTDFSSQMTVADATGIVVGMLVTSASGINAGTNVLAVDGTTIVVNQTFSTTATGQAVTFTGHGVLGNFDGTKDGPSTDNDNNALVGGQLYYNSTDLEIRLYNGSSWVPAYVTGGNFLALAGGTMTGNLIFSGSQTVDGRDVSVDGAKLDNIEELADVTDAANVAAAGAAMLTGATFTGAVVVDNQLDIEEVHEKVTVITSTTGTLTFDTAVQGVVLGTADQTANRTINFTNVNSTLAIGQSVTCAVLLTQGSTAYYLNAYQVDASSVTPKWQGGTAPSAGNTSGIDAYSFTIIKTADATFTVLASQTQFA